MSSGWEEALLRQLDAKSKRITELEAEVHELRQKYVVTKPVSYPLQGYWRN